MQRVGKASERSGDYSIEFHQVPRSLLHTEADFWLSVSVCFSSCLGRLTITSREMSITCALRAHFSARSFRVLNIPRSNNKYGLFPLNCIKIPFYPPKNSQQMALYRRDRALKWRHRNPAMQKDTLNTEIRYALSTLARCCSETEKLITRLSVDRFQCGLNH